MENSLTHTYQSFSGLFATGTEAEMRRVQPRSQSSSAISDVTSPVKLVGKVRRAIALGSKLPPVTWIARSGQGTRLRRVIVSAIVTGVAPVSYWPIFPLRPY